VGDESVIGGAAEGLVKGAEASREEVSEIFNYQVWGTLLDAALDMGTVRVNKYSASVGLLRVLRDEPIEVLHW
jgi:hypothetical protein